MMLISAHREVMNPSIVAVPTNTVTMRTFYASSTGRAAS